MAKMINLSNVQLEILYELLSKINTSVIGTPDDLIRVKDKIKRALDKTQQSTENMKRGSTVGFERKEVYKISDVLPYVQFVSKDNGKLMKKDYDGDLINMTSDRYKCFSVSGISCVKCGVTGKFFAKERRGSIGIYHFNLYALDNFGTEVLMTKDHIIPISKGGKDILENYQTMCFSCNVDKDSLLEGE